MNVYILLCFMFAIIIQYFTYLLRIFHCVNVFLFLMISKIAAIRKQKKSEKVARNIGKEKKKQNLHSNAIICVYMCSGILAWSFFDDFIRKRLRSVKLLLNAINLKKATLRVLYIMYVCKMRIFNHSY